MHSFHIVNVIVSDYLVPALLKTLSTILKYLHLHFIDKGVYQDERKSSWFLIFLFFVFTFCFPYLFLQSYNWILLTVATFGCLLAVQKCLDAD